MRIRIRAFERCNWIFPLADILTPGRREHARHRHSDSAIRSTLAKPRDDPNRDPSVHMGGAPPPNNVELNGKHNLLKLPEGFEELVEGQVDALDDEFAEGESHLDPWRQTEDGLKDILAQFQIDETQFDQIIEIFQDYMTASSFDLRLRSISAENRCG